MEGDRGEFGDQVGSGIGSVGRINGDSLEDFAYRSTRTGYWYVFFGGSPAPDTTADWIWEEERSSGELTHPVVGNFLGTGQHHIGFQSYRRHDPNNSTDVCFILYLYRVAGGTIETEAEYSWDPGRTMDTTWRIFPNDMFAMNVDGEAGDELIVPFSVSVREKVRSQVGEIWLYKGGADFQVDQPTHVIVDEQANTKEDEYRLYIADFDGDSFADLILTARYADGSKLKLWFGNEGSPWNWTNTPDRTLFIDGLGLGRQLSVADFDGDRIVDIAASVGNAPEPGTYIYLSSKGKSVRDRSFNYSDADVELQSTQYQIPIGGGHGGYLADSSGRYAMLGLIGPSKYDSHEPMLLLFGGGKNGPNGTWDAEYAPSRDGVTPGPVMQHIVPIGDCDGDGWADLLLSDDDWYLFDHGIAMVIAGGPEIPTDDTTLSVRAIATEEHRGALHIWPNPMRDKLQIVWRGDLRRLPRRLTIHNALGELVAEGEVEPGVGAARWESRDTPSGMYLLTVYDTKGEVLATTEVIKVE
ncbi:MAG: VCBS repeat-containing protein [Candidatus Kapaibacterium sp.]